MKKTFNKITTIDNTNLWLFIELESLVEELYVVGIIYLKPSLNNNTYLEIFEEQLKNVINFYSNHKIIILGGFNPKISNLNQLEKGILDNQKVASNRSTSNLRTNKSGR